MISELYKRPSKYTGKLRRSASNTIDMCKVWNGDDACVESLDQFKISHLKLFLIRLLPSISCCLPLNKEEELFEEGKNHYERQVNIIEFMKSHRELKAVVKELIDRQGVFMLEQTPEIGYVQEKEEDEKDKTKSDNELSICYTQPAHE